MTDTWLQQEDESEKAYKYFRTFLELGETRTIRATAEICKTGEQNLKNNFVYKHKWWARARSYDDRPRIANMEGRIAAAFEAGRDSEILRIRADEADRLNKLSEIFKTSAVKMAAKLQSLDPNEIKASTLPAFMSAIAKVATAVTNSQAALSGMDEILSEIENAEDSA